MTPDQLTVLVSNNDKYVLLKVIEVMNFWTPEEKGTYTHLHAIKLNKKAAFSSL